MSKKPLLTPGGAPQAEQYEAVVNGPRRQRSRGGVVRCFLTAQLLGQRCYPIGLGLQSRSGVLWDTGRAHRHPQDHPKGGVVGYPGKD